MGKTKRVAFIYIKTRVIIWFDWQDLNLRHRSLKTCMLTAVPQLSVLFTAVTYSPQLSSGSNLRFCRA